VICPKCNSRIPATSKFCPECGQSLEIRAVETKKCPKCGNEVLKSAKFCPDCGNKFEE